MEFACWETRLRPRSYLAWRLTGGDGPGKSRPIASTRTGRRDESHRRFDALAQIRDLRLINALIALLRKQGPITQIVLKWLKSCRFNELSPIM